jgi:hypothetical protein
MSETSVGNERERRAYNAHFHIGQHPDHYLPNRQLVAHHFGFALVTVAHSELDYFVKYWYFSLVFVVTLLMNVVSI